MGDSTATRSPQPDPDPRPNHICQQQVQLMIENSGKFESEQVKELVETVFKQVLTKANWTDKREMQRAILEGSISIETFATSVAANPEIVKIFEGCFS